eukprot:scaffold183_cov249-Pinguiococcus_pyrenoidosus.AAC.9
MDRGEYENELKQVIGDAKAAYDISEHDTLIFGGHGLLVAGTLCVLILRGLPLHSALCTLHSALCACVSERERERERRRTTPCRFLTRRPKGPNSRHHEPLLCAYLQFITIDIFVQNFFARMWILTDDMHTTKKIIDVDSKADPKSLSRCAEVAVCFQSKQKPDLLRRIRDRICALSNDVIELEEILGYVLEALEIIEVPPEPPEQAGRSLYDRLEIAGRPGRIGTGEQGRRRLTSDVPGMRSQLIRRSTDLKKNIAGAIRYLDVLREMAGVVAETRSFQLTESLEAQMKRLCDLQSSNERAADSLQILQIIFAGISTSDLLKPES